ncbi:MAG: hypothetical protein L6416_11120 [Candidatus Omnitrophica bacterium]|nr:hypothetical protein [Candidatus Omnitrophota bacterium]
MRRFAGKITFNTLLILILSLLCVMFLVLDSQAGEFKEEHEKFIYTADGRPDPLLPLLSSKGLVAETGLSIREEMMNFVSKINVNAILWDETMPIVMINKKMRKEGDVVENLIIQKINVNGVIFGYNDLAYEILMIKKKKMNDQGGVQ